MKQKLSYLIKYNKVIYTLYSVIIGTCIRILKIFVKTNDKLILFNSFGGRKFDDSPKAVFEQMKKDPRFSDYCMVWAFHQPEKHRVTGAKKIKTDGFQYFKTALSARVWITNSAIERGLRFKGKDTFYLNTWHGSPIKKMGTDIQANKKARGFINVDIMNTQSNFEADIFSRCFGIPRDHFIEVGLPRNDELYNYTDDYKNELKKRIGIPINKKVLLYCPTFREYEKDKNYDVILTPPMSLKKWEELLGDRYVLLFRAHYEVTKVMDIKENGFLKNVTDYPVLNDLMIVSDILISDYSSIFFDYAIMDKCMLHFTYDYEKYAEKRGMYFDIRDYINGSDTEDGVIDIINNLNYMKEVEKTKRFREKYINFFGHAAQQTVDCIADHIM